MTEPEFLAQCERVLDAIEDAIDRSGIDAQTLRSGHLLELEFEDGSKIIVNGNTPVRQIWVAARSGGYHFSERDGRWLDTRSGTELFEGLSGWVSQQSGAAVTLRA